MVQEPFVYLLHQSPPTYETRGGLFEWRCRPPPCNLCLSGAEFVLDPPRYLPTHQPKADLNDLVNTGILKQYSGLYWYGTIGLLGLAMQIHALRMLQDPWREPHWALR